MSSVNVTVLNALCDYMVNNSVDDSSIDNAATFNRTVYEMLLLGLKSTRPYLESYCSDLKQDTKPKSKKDEIRLNVMKKSIDQDIQALVAKHDEPIFRNWKHKESKLVSMLLWGLDVIELIKSDPDRANTYNDYNALMSLCAAIADANINGDLVSNDFDLIGRVYKFLAKKLCISELFLNYSELIVSNFYTTRYPSKDIKPYPAQKAVMDVYRQSLSQDKPLCISYSTETGSGKTYLSLALARAHRMHTKPTDLSTNTFIFVCYNVAVRKMVLSMCDKLNIPACMIEAKGVSWRGDVGPVFTLNRCSINIKSKSEGSNSRSRKDRSTGENIIKAEWAKFDAFMKVGNNEEKIRNQFVYLNSIKDHEQSFNAALPQIYICDPECAAHLVKIAPDSTVFVDEPDVDNNELADQYAEILKQCPKRTIIVSATLGDLTPYTNKFSENHRDAIISTVNFGTTGIHSTVIIGDHIYLPHHEYDTNSRDELVNILKTTPLIKLYSPMAIAMMCEHSEYNINQYFDFKTVTYDEIRKFIIDYFENVMLIEDHRLLTVDKQIKKPLTADDHMRTGQTLVIVNKPYTQLLSWEDGLFLTEIDAGKNSLIELDPKNKNPTAYNINFARRKYIDELVVYKGLLRQIKTNATSKNKHRDGESRSAVEHKVAEHSRHEPTMYFPPTAIIGSKAHALRYKYDNTTNTRSRMFTPSDDLFDSVDSELIKWLYAGVGLYENDLCKNYKNITLAAAEEGSLAYLISNPELIRGMDYRFDMVIIDKEFTSTASQSSIKQTIGRVGRPGSSRATIVFSDNYEPNFRKSDEQSALFKQKLSDFVVNKPADAERKITKFQLSSRKEDVPINDDSNDDDDEDSWLANERIEKLNKLRTSIIDQLQPKVAKKEEVETADAW